MATGGEQEDVDALTCALCLEEFKTPKFLPCHHTFCLKCLEHLTTHIGGSTFPCPQCRCEVTIPEGGVAAFQENFYIKPEGRNVTQSEGQRASQSGGLNVKQSTITCPSHAGEVVDLYCVECSVSLCLKCLMTKHKNHDTKDLKDVVKEAGDQLKDDEARLQMAVTYMTRIVEEENTLQDALKQKTAQLEEVIREKYTTLLALAEKARDDALASLKTISEEIDSRMTRELNGKQSNLDELRQMQEKLQSAVLSGDTSQLLTVSNEMSKGRGRSQALQHLLSPKRSCVFHPLLSSKITEDAIPPQFQDFFGTVEEMKMRIIMPVVEVAKKFCCGDAGEDVEVFSLCPKNDGGEVVVSFARRGQNEAAPSEEFDENGVHLVTQDDARGKQNWKSLSDGRCIHVPFEESGQVCSYAKSRKKTMFMLSNTTASGRFAVVNQVIVDSDESAKIKPKQIFSIQVGIYRAFDVDSTETLFVVLEEAKPPDTQRKVQLYRYGQRRVVATYQAQLTTFQPSDVCFYKTSGGQEVLVIADEASGRLHVVDVRNGEFKFKCYSSRLVQPTALNTDSKGRLWVSCKGGTIMTVTNLGGLPFAVPAAGNTESGSSRTPGKKKVVFSKMFQTMQTW